MMDGTIVFAWVVPLELPLLLAVAFEDCRIQVQGVALWPLCQALHLPLRQRFKQALHLAHAELAKQIADSIVGGKTVHAQQRMQRAISSQQTGVSEPSSSHQHRYQKRGEGTTGIDVIRRPPADLHVLPNSTHEANLFKKRNENRDPTKPGHGALP